MEKLPIGIQHFPSLRQEGYVYVDKTEHIHRLMNTGKFVFLSRPRRFGKSLLISTLQQIYLGRKELFQGLWIEDQIDWQPRPVLVINFNDVSYREKRLAVALEEHIDSLAQEQGLQLEGTGYKRKFQEIITLLSAEHKIVLLIDEYDKAITDLLENGQQVTENLGTLKDFYSVLKSSASEHIHWCFLTGISKYGKMSIFSDLNNLLDITTDARFATLLGYTQEELEHSFAHHIDALAERFAVSRPEILESIRFWYNGFSWDGRRTVYVPFSTLVFLEQQTFENHWFATASPSFLLKLLKQKQLPAYVLERLRGDSALLNSADVNNIDVIALLFQTGYLTIKRVQSSLSGQRYELGYPNYEVANSFQQYLLAEYINLSTTQIGLVLLSELKDALESQNLEQFITILNAVFAGIPHTLFLPQEAYYHSIIYLILKLLGFSIVAEPLTSRGRIDAVLELADILYILEFKMSTAQIALDQIKARGYDQPYRASGKVIQLIGIAFDEETRQIGEWQSAAAN